jgi:hypothetical protein
MLALVAVEGGRLLRHPAVLAAAVLSAWMLWRYGTGTVPVLHHADVASQLSLAPLAGAALLATNLAVLRPYRDGAVDLYGATRLSLGRRTLAHLITVLPLVALGAILVAADLAWLAGMPGSAGTVNLAEAATGPALILLGGCLGVLLGRLGRSVALAPLVLVATAIGSLTLAELHVGGHDQRPWTWLGTLLRPVPSDPPPPTLLGRPATWHLAYLLGAAVAFGALALWRGQARSRARVPAQVATAAVLVAALAVTAGAAVVQTRPTSTALVARRVAAATNPQSVLACQRRGPAVYCVFPGFEPQIALMEPTVRAVVAEIPPAAAARALPVTVAQRVGWHRVLKESETGTGCAAGDCPVVAPVAPVGTVWPRQGGEFALSQARLAANVAARLIDPPAAAPPGGEEPGDEKPSAGEPKPNPGPGPAPASGGVGCGARGVVGLLLAARANPHAADAIREQVTQPRFPSFVFAHDPDGPDGDAWWGVREGQFALALLGRPGDQVLQALWRDWDLATAPDTTVERLGELLGVQPPAAAPTDPAGDALGGGSC